MSGTGRTDHSFGRDLQRLDSQPGTLVGQPPYRNDPQTGRTAPRAAGTKLPPNVERFIYRIDRTEQCEALLPRLYPELPDRPVCAIAAGTEDDCPTTLGNTLVDYITEEILDVMSLPRMEMPRSPVMWKKNWDSCEKVWKEIGKHFLELPGLTAPDVVRLKLSQRPGSVAIGLEVNADEWNDRATAVKAWIDSLRHCQVTAGRLVLVLIVVSGPPADAALINTVRTELEKHYCANHHVLVLPLLDAVAYRDMKEWHRDLLNLARSSHAIQNNLQGMLGHLFGETVQTFRLGHYLDRLRDYIDKAWVHS